MFSKLSDKIVKSIQILFAECDHRVLNLQDENVALRMELMQWKDMHCRKQKEYLAVRENLINTVNANREKLELLETVCRQGVDVQSKVKLFTEILFDIDVDQINEVLRSIQTLPENKHKSKVHSFKLTESCDD